MLKEFVMNVESVLGGKEIDGASGVALKPLSESNGDLLPSLGEVFWEAVPIEGLSLLSIVAIPRKMPTWLSMKRVEVAFHAMVVWMWRQIVLCSVCWESDVQRAGYPNRLDES